MTSNKPHNKSHNSKLSGHHRHGGQGAGHKGSKWDVPAKVASAKAASVPSSRKLRPATLHWDEHDRMHGVVKNDASDAQGGAHFHVHDHEVNGVSHRDLTGDSPEFQPIPLTRIAQHEGHLQYHDEPSDEGAESSDEGGEPSDGTSDGGEAGSDEQSEDGGVEGADNSKPGYFVWHGALGRLSAPDAAPEHFDGAEWQPVQDAAKFFQSAERITATQAEALAHHHGVQGEF
jgi:hypothetical protein